MPPKTKAVKDKERKTMKKIVALVMALVLVFALSVSAMAAELTLIIASNQTSAENPYHFGKKSFGANISLRNGNQRALRIQQHFLLLPRFQGGYGAFASGIPKKALQRMIITFVNT